MHARTNILLSRRHGVTKTKGYLVYEHHDTTQLAKFAYLMGFIKIKNPSTPSSQNLNTKTILFYGHQRIKTLWFPFQEPTSPLCGNSYLTKQFSNTYYM